MKLIVHMGLHKTGSTWVQTVFRHVARSILPRGIFYASQEHHSIAWALLRRNFDPLRKMIAEARNARSHTLVFSAEDLENLLFKPAEAAELVSVVADLEVGEVEWLICLRRQADYFSSLYAEMSRHTYLDAFQMLFDVMTEGKLYLPSRSDRPGPPYWEFCFDYDKFVPAFASQAGGRLHICDFADRFPYPLWRLFDALGIADLVSAATPYAQRNERLPADDVAERYRQAFARALTDVDTRDALAAKLAERVAVDGDLSTLMADQVARRFDTCGDSSLCNFAFRMSPVRNPT